MDMTTDSPSPVRESAWSPSPQGVRDGDYPHALWRVSEDALATRAAEDASHSVCTSPRKTSLPQRSKSSAGTPSNFSRRRDIAPTGTRDDMHLSPLARHRVESISFDSTSARTRGPVVSPASPDAPSSHDSPSMWQPTPGTMNVPPGEIGMALGSPHHPPAAWHDVPEERLTESPDRIDEDGGPSTPRMKPKKSSTWKKIGGLFGGKKADARSAAFYQVQTETASASPADHGFDFAEAAAASEKPPKPRKLQRHDTSARKTKPKSGGKREDAAPVHAGLGSIGGDAPRDASERPLDGGHARPAQQSTGLLDVDIPTVRLERFSVMFQGVLQRPDTQHFSPLLSRRQTTLEILKTTGEEFSSKERETGSKRRMTSPVLPKIESPSLSLFPNTPRARDHTSTRPRNASSPRRANPSPAVISPSRTSFAKGISDEGHAPLVATAPPNASKVQKAQVVRQPRKSSLTKHVPNFVLPSSASNAQEKWARDEFHLVLDSSSEEADEVDEGKDFSPVPVAQPKKPRHPESQRRVLHNPHSASLSSVSSSATSSSTFSTAARDSYMTTPPLSAKLSPYPVVRAPSQSRSRPPPGASSQRPAVKRAQSDDAPADGPAPNATSRRAALRTRANSYHTPLSSPISEDEARLESAAEVSIARQISVSRQQKQMLVPIKTSAKEPSAGDTTTTKDRSSNGEEKKKKNEKMERGVGAPHSPEPVKILGLSSPLSAIAIATTEERERISPSFDPSDHGIARCKEISPTTQRLMLQSAKPSMPTVVIVDTAANEPGGGAASDVTRGPHVPGRPRPQDAASPSPLAGELQVGLAISRDSSPVRRVPTHRQHGNNRKSEWAVVESVSD